MTTPVKVLMVEDRADDAELIVHALRQSGLEPDWVRVETEAEYRARLDEKFDLILADATLPQFSAGAALRILNERGFDIPLIIVTGSLSEEVAVGFMKQGAADYLLKDRMTRLGEAVRGALEEKRLRAEKQTAERAKEGANRAYRTLSAGNRSLLRSSTEEELVKSICEAGVRASGYRMVWVGYAEHDKNKTVRPVAWAGDEGGFVTRTLLSWGGSLKALRPGPKSIRTRNLVIVQNIATDPAYEQWRDEAKQLRYSSALAVPLILDDQSVLGCITFYAEEPDAFDAKETDLLLEMTGDLAYGIQAIRTRALHEMAEAALRESEERFRTIVESAPMVVLVADPTGKIVQVNQRIAEIFGYTPEEAIGQPVDILIPPEVARAHGRDFRRFMQKPEVRQMGTRPELMGVRKDGSRFPVDVALGPIRIRGETFAVARVADITERKQAEQALRESHARLSAFANALPDLGFILDQDGHYIEILTQQDQLLADGLDSLLGRPMHDVLPAPQADLILEGVRATIQTGATQVIEYSLDVPAGHRWFEGRTALMETAPGEGARVVMLARDITERKRLEEAEREQRLLAETLRATAAALSSTLDLSEVLNYILEHIGRVLPHDAKTIMLVEGSIAHVASHGGYAERGLGEAVSQVSFVIDNVPNLAEMARSGHSLCITNVLDYPGWVPTDATAWIRSSVGAPIRVRDKVLGFINLESATPGFFSDVHARRLQAFADQAATAINNAQLFHELEAYNEFLEQAVKDRTADIENFKDRLESIFNNCPDPILLLDRYGYVETANPAFYQLLRIKTDDLYKRSLPDLVISDLEEAVRYALHEVMVKRKTRRLEVTVRRADETTFEADMALALIRQGVRMHGAVCILRDITTFKEVERLKDEFVSNVSHELRTPITSIKLNQDLITRDPARQDVYLQRLSRETDRLKDLIEDLLRLSRLDQGRLEMRLETTDLNVLVAQYVSDRAPLAQSRQLDLADNLKPGACLVTADTGLLGQVLSILLTNAINYTPAGGKIIVQTHERAERTGQRAGFSVADTGPGISADEQSRLFERFFRGRVGKSSGAPGTGLGLAIAKKIVDRHGGMITVASDGVPGAGTTFSVWLPASGDRASVRGST